MKLSTLFLIFLIAVSCKSPGKEEVKLSAEEHIAKAHGFSNWDKVKRIDFKFRVAFDTVNRDRHWSWWPKKGDVTLIMNNDTISYNRSNIDTLQLKADQRFINDKFWLLVPFQLVWDEGITISEPLTSLAPMSQKEYQSITIKYGDQGGYTPGDTYKIFFDNKYIIREWVYQSSDTSRPPRSYSFENYKEYHGIKFATTHKVHEREVSIDFPDIQVHLEE